MVTGGADSKIIVWADETKEFEEEEEKAHKEKTRGEQELSNMIFMENWREAALKAFELGKNRDLFFILEKIEHSGSQINNPEQDQDEKCPVMSILNNEDQFEKQFELNSEIEERKIQTEEMFTSVVIDLLKMDPMRLI